MKNLTFNKLFLYIFIFTAGAFAFSYGFATVAGDKPYPDAVLEKLEEHMNGTQLPVDIAKEWNSSEIKEIEVTTGSVSVELAKSSDAVIRAHLKGISNPSSKIEFEVNNGRLSVRVNNRSGLHWTFNSDVQVSMTARELKLYISLPENYHGPIKVVTGSGDISSRSVHLKEAEVRTGSGDIEFKGLTSDRLSISTGSGDLSASGRVTQFTAKTGSGEISLEDVIGDSLEISTGSGDISLENPDFQKISTQASSGDVSVKLGGDAARWTAHAATSSGDIDSNLPNADRSKSSKLFDAGTGKSRIDVSTSSGDIQITL